MIVLAFRHRIVSMSGMLKLGVNIDHVATLREARGVTYPSVLEAAAACESAGAHGITVHLREDRRHIQDADVYALRPMLHQHLNLEMGNHPDILSVALEVLPDEVCLVPEKREELTTEGGLDVVGHYAELETTVSSLAEAGIVVSMFIDPDEAQIRATADLGAPYIELHTGAYCNATGEVARAELDRLHGGAVLAHDLGLHVNAGHGLTLDNVEGIFGIPHLDTLNIGHSIVAHAVFVGLPAAVAAMLEVMSAYRGDAS